MYHDVFLVQIVGWEGKLEYLFIIIIIILLI